MHVKADQVEQRKEKYPDNVHEVPVETRILNRIVILRRVSALPREIDQE
jgi:hypothetical protein